MKWSINRKAVSDLLSVVNSARCQENWDDLHASEVI